MWLLFTFDEIDMLNVEKLFFSGRLKLSKSMCFKCNRFFVEIDGPERVLNFDQNGLFIAEYALLMFLNQESY